MTKNRKFLATDTDYDNLVCVRMMMIKGVGNWREIVWSARDEHEIGANIYLARRIMQIWISESGSITAYLGTV